MEYWGKMGKFIHFPTRLVAAAVLFFYPTPPVLDTGGNFLRKKEPRLLKPPKQARYLTIFNENIFFKTQDTRLYTMVTTNKGLE